MNQEFILDSILVYYKDINDSNFVYFKQKLEDFTNILNETLGVNSFNFLVEGIFVVDMFQGKIILKDGDLIVWQFELNLQLDKLKIDTFLSITFQTFYGSTYYHNMLFFCLGPYIVMNYPEQARKIKILS